MRRSDREVTERSEILAIMDKCDSLSLSFMDGEYPYVIPMNFGYIDDGERLTLYFHGAKEGKKLELLQKNPNAAFCMSTQHELIFGKVPCATTFKYESVCGRGKLSLVTGDERFLALQKIMNQFDKDGRYEFDERHAKAVSIFKMDVEAFTGKRRSMK